MKRRRRNRRRGLSLPAIAVFMMGAAVVLQLSTVSWQVDAHASADSASDDHLLDLKSEELYRGIRAWQDNRREPVVELLSPRWEKVEQEVVELISRQSFPVAVYIKDLKNGFIIRYRDREPMPSASLVKVPVLMAVFRDLAAGRLSYDDFLVLHPYLKAGGSGYLQSRPAGSKVSVRELVTAMITCSDNTATNMLVNRVGMQKVNRVCRQFGMVGTDMIRGVMDLQARDRGIENMTTARDMGTALEYLQRDRVWGKQWSSEMISVLLDCHSRARLPRYLPDDFPVAHKTGLLRNVVHDVGILYFYDRPVIVSVLTKDMPSADASREFIGRVARLVYDEMMAYEESFQEKYGSELES